MSLLDIFKRKELPAPGLSTMRTVNPGDIHVTGLPDHTKPTSRMDVLQVIEDNVKNELESIDYEVTKLKVRLIDLYNRRRKYALILDATKDNSCNVETNTDAWPKNENTTLGQDPNV